MRKAARFCKLRYGFYREDELRAALARCKTMIFLCEHRRKGSPISRRCLAACQFLSWDRGGFGRTRSFTRTGSFSPVSSVPYWDDRCGIKFASIEAFDDAWRRFWDGLQSGRYDRSLVPLRT